VSQNTFVRIILTGIGAAGWVLSGRYGLTLTAFAAWRVHIPYTESVSRKPKYLHLHSLISGL